jgi:hypothetical protein
MESIIGWERVMLVFGYADNEVICQMIVGISRSDPKNRDRRFRCSPAN